VLTSVTLGGRFLRNGRPHSDSDHPMAAKRRSRHRSRRIPKARVLRTSPPSRTDVTRAEYKHIIDILNERNEILNALRDGFQGLEHVTDIQFKRIAQIQADLDEIKRAWQRLKVTR
jgi:hypothetical protein